MSRIHTVMPEKPTGSKETIAPIKGETRLHSALPLGVWPFEPEQSFEHHLSHAIWAIAEPPLMWETIPYVRTSRQEK